MSSTDSHQEHAVNILEAENIERRYSEGRVKRLREDGASQFIDVSLSEKFRYFQDDPWAQDTEVKDAQAMFPNNRCEVFMYVKLYFHPTTFCVYFCPYPL